jgi:hypothetical protein
VIDRTEHDVETEQKRTEAVDDAHADHSVDPDEEGSDMPSEEELRDEAETDG